MKFFRFGKYQFIISLVASCNTISKQSLLEECDVVAENVVTDKGDTLLVCDYDAVSHYVSIPLSLLVDVIRPHKN